MLTLDEARVHALEVASVYESDINYYKMNHDTEWLEENEEECRECAKEHRQLAEWLTELKAYREFADWLVKAVLEKDWEESADFYAEVLCRKLTKLGKLKVVDNKYVEVNADE